MEMRTKYSAVNLLPDLKIDIAKYGRIPSEQEILASIRAIQARGINVIRVDNGTQALATIKKIIPSFAEVMNGSSTTLIEIGYQDLLESDLHNWKDLHRLVTNENDPIKRIEIRRKAVTAEYFLSGVNAIAMSGELVSCDATGSRVGAWPFAAKHLLLVSGVNKIVPTLQDALERVIEYAYPLEDARIRKASGVPSQIGKFAIIANESQPGRTSLLLINDSLGY